MNKPSLNTWWHSGLCGGRGDLLSDVEAYALLDRMADTLPDAEAETNWPESMRCNC